MASKLQAKCLWVFRLETPQGKAAGRGGGVTLKPGQTKIPVDAPPGDYRASLQTKIEIQDPLYLELLETYKDKKLARAMRNTIPPPPPIKGSEFPYRQFDITRWNVTIDGTGLRITSIGKTQSMRTELLDIPGGGSVDPSSLIPGYSNENTTFEIKGKRMLVKHDQKHTNDAVFLRSVVSLNNAPFFDKTVSAALVLKPAKNLPKAEEKPQKSRTKTMVYFVGPFVTGEDDPWKLDRKAKGSRVGRPINTLLKDVENWPANTWSRLEENQTPGGETIKIVGFADPRDTEKANRSLSERRARNVKEALQKAIGGPNGNFNVRGAGERGKKPDDPNWRVVKVEAKITL